MTEQLLWSAAGIERLKRATAHDDHGEVHAYCAQLIAQIADQPAVPLDKASVILEELKRARQFEAMRNVSDALLARGPLTAALRNQRVQALVDTGELDQAELEARSLLADSTSDLGNALLAEGLLGRVLKQRFVSRRAADDLGEAIATYKRVFERAPQSYWHGINALALLRLREGHTAAPEPATRALAEQLRDQLESMIPDTRGYWGDATLAEVYLGLGQPERALAALAAALGAPGVHPFQLAGTLRQLREIWQLAPDDPLVMTLQTALLGREGAVTTLEVGDTAATLKTLEREPKRLGKQFEAVFGTDGYERLAWFHQMLKRVRAIGRVEERFGKAVGSGFLISAAEFFPKRVDLASAQLFITNAHVLGDTWTGALRPENAVVCFEGADNQQVEVAELLWESRPQLLDVSIVRLAQSVDGVEPLPIAPITPLTHDLQRPRRLFCIGYPLGGPLSVSLQDSLQLGWNDPRVHYRTPTEPGSSGSPVFDRQWRLAAVHHLARVDMPRADGTTGTYQANEGIWIHAVKAAIANS